MPLRLLSTMALQGVLETLDLPGIDAQFHPTARLLDRIRAGERADLAILTADAVDTLGADAILGPRTDLARSFVGVAIRAGAPHPDIATPDAFVATLHAARSLAMSEAGASGLFMADLLRRLGIADAIRAKATILHTGYTAALAADGTVELAVQQISELLMVDGIEIVGRLPAALGGDTVFAAAPFRDTPDPQAAAALLATLRDPANAPVYDRCGLEPIGTAGPMTA